MDVFRSVLENIYIYGCFNQELLAEKCGYSSSKLKLAKKFYDTCLAEHIGYNYIVKTEKARGRAASASYLCCRRFSSDKNYLYSAYLWSSVAKIDLCKYIIIRQYIKYYESESSKCKSELKDYLKGQTLLKEYFSICFNRKYEHIGTFLLKFCDEKNIPDLVYNICDALTVFGRKAPYSVPAYSIIEKLKRYCNCEGIINDIETDIWDITYDNLSCILYDDTVYTIIQAIRNKQAVCYTQSFDNSSKIYIIPLKIMREFVNGRIYLFYGISNSDSIFVIRIDKMFKVEICSVKKEFTEKYNDHIEKLKNELLSSAKTIWLSGDYTTKNINRTVILKIINKEALAYIKKYYPGYEYNKENETVKVVLRKADDIKPFIRYLGDKAVISKDDNPVLYQEFQKDIFEINSYYSCSGIIPYEQDNINTVREKKKIKEKNNDAPKEFVNSTKGFRLFNKFNSYSSIMLEDILYYLLFECKNTEEYTDIEPAIKKSFSNCGFNTDLEYYGRMVERFLGDMNGINSSENDFISDSFFLSIDSNSEKKSNDGHIEIKAAIKNDGTGLYDTFPAQIFTDYEYEYLLYMLKDSEARCFIPDEIAQKIEDELSKHFPDIANDDVYMTRFANDQSPVKTTELQKNFSPVCKALHYRKKIRFTYKNRTVTASPYRLSYSLRERVLRLIIKCDDEEWIRRINIDRMEDIEVLDDSSIDKSEFESSFSKKKKYIELVIHKNKNTTEKNVFERALRIFGSYEKYTWDDCENNDYVIAVAYYDFDVLIKSENKKRIYKMDTVAGDILSLGKYAEVLETERFRLPEKQNIEYDSDMYNEIKKVYRKLEHLYRNQ